MDHYRLAEAESCAIQIANRSRFGADPVKHFGDLLFIQVAQLEAQHRLSRDYVVGAGFSPDPADGPDLPSGHCGDHLVYFLNESGSRQQSIVALVHGSGPGMIGKAFDGDFGVQNAYDSLDHAYVDLLLLQNGSLLDMEFEVSGDAFRTPIGVAQLVDITTDEFNSFAHGLATLALEVEQLVVGAGAEDVAAYGASFFVLKEDDLERMAQLNSVFIQDLCDLDGSQRTKNAIVVATLGDRINVGADEQRLERSVATRTRTNDVSRRIDVHRESCLAHELHGVFASLAVSFGVGDAADAPFRVLAKVGHCLKALENSLIVDLRSGAGLRGGP